MIQLSSSLIIAAAATVIILTTPTVALRLYLVRHGDPEYIDLFSGLTEHGRAEAKALAPFLATLGITHAYTSPMQRAKLTAEIALQDIPQFSTLHKTGDKNNFETNVGIQDWSAEKQSWQASESKLAQALLVGTVIWDLPAPMIRNQLAEIVNGTSESSGWVHLSPDHGQWIEYYQSFCQDVDDFLAQHGIVRAGANYRMSAKDAANPDKREAQIVLFGHGGTFLILLAHLLQIPLPMVHASMWLPPSSVTTILFEEYTAKDEMGPTCSDDSTAMEEGSLVLTPRAIGIGGTTHLALAGMDIALSKYEQGKRPSGLKHNYW